MKTIWDHMKSTPKYSEVDVTSCQKLLRDQKSVLKKHEWSKGMMKYHEDCPSLALILILISAKTNKGDIELLLILVVENKNTFQRRNKIETSI